jgi:hypothetical protein
MTSAPPRFARARRAFLAGIVLLLAGCGSPIPPDQRVNGPLPPPPPGMAQLVFYRDLDYYGTQAMPTVYLNDVPAGITQNGAVLYRNVAPGRYEITLAPTLPYPGQFKTLVVRAGDVYYVKIGTLPLLGGRVAITERSYEDTFILTVVDPRLDAQEIQGLRLIGG